ncbi:MAG: leucine-rich repeat protein [Bacilli bacterium]|nr:leucine-rich repeat protein [Bacilli bacterium]MBR1582016.1 leucine-rich repeat protein [Bacilli bacterium]
MKHFKKLLVLIGLSLISSMSFSCKKNNPRYITDTYINENKELIVVYSDGSTENKGSVKDKDSAPEELKGKVILNFNHDEGSVTANTLEGLVGDKITLTITPKENYLIEEVRLNSVPLAAPYEFNLVEGENIVDVIFKEIPEVDPIDPTIETVLVIFKNFDGTELYRAEINKGKNAVYLGSTPTKPSNEQYNYEFTGWDKPLENIQVNTTFTATYKQVTRKYKVTFINYDGQVLQSEEVLYGEIPLYTGITPEKPGTATTTYEFLGWDKPLTEVKGEVTYTAVFVENYAPTYRNKGFVFEIQPENASFYVKKFYGDDKNIVIPSEFEGRPVIGIKDEAFKDNTQMNSIYIPETIEYIGNNVFFGCENITKVMVSTKNTHFKILNDYKLIGNDTELIYVVQSFNTILDLTNDNLETIRDGALNCNHLKTLVISGDLLTSTSKLFGGEEYVSETMHSIVIDGGNIKKDAFKNAKNLRSVSFINNPTNPTTEIGESAFEGCEGVQELFILDEVKKLGNRCFANMPGLKKLTFGTGDDINIEEYGLEMLDGTNNIDGYYVSNMGPSLYCLGNETKRSMIIYKQNNPESATSKTLEVDYGVEFIAKGAFTNSTLTKVDFNYGYGLNNDYEDQKLKCIDTEAFAGVTNLASAVALPTTLTKVGLNVFTGTKLATNASELKNVEDKTVYLLKNTFTNIADTVIGIEDSAFTSNTNTITVNSENKVFIKPNDYIIKRKDLDILYKCYDQGYTEETDGTTSYYTVVLDAKIIAPYAYNEIGHVKALKFLNVERIEKDAIYRMSYVTNIFFDNTLTTLNSRAINDSNSIDYGKYDLTLQMPKTLINLGEEAIYTRRRIRVETDASSILPTWEDNKWHHSYSTTVTYTFNKYYWTY